MGKRLGLGRSRARTTIEVVYSELKPSPSLGTLIPPFPCKLPGQRLLCLLDYTIEGVRNWMCTILGAENSSPMHVG